MRPTLSAALAAVPIVCVALAARPLAPSRTVNDKKLELGAFSVSLAVKDLAASRAFYEKLGFALVGGVQEQNWLILRNGTTTIGLFQGILEANVLTFNPGWSADAQPLAAFTDVRELQRRVEAAGLEPEVRADESSDGPAHFVLVDPDGNRVFVDQHVPKPK